MSMPRAITSILFSSEAFELSTARPILDADWSINARVSLCCDVVWSLISSVFFLASSSTLSIRLSARSSPLFVGVKHHRSRRKEVKYEDRDRGVIGCKAQQLSRVLPIQEVLKGGSRGVSACWRRKCTRSARLVLDGFVVYMLNVSSILQLFYFHSEFKSFVVKVILLFVSIHPLQNLMRIRTCRSWARWR